MTTVRDLITSSFRLIGVVGAGENLTAEDAVDAQKTLNQMLSSWSADGSVIYSRSVDTLNLISQQTYTMGPGGDINTIRPVSITQATYTLSNIVYPMNIWAQNTYSALTYPTLQGPIPTDLFVNNGTPLLTLQIYPIPTNGVLTLYSLKPLAGMSLNDVLDLPPGYEKALRTNLAVELAPEYEKEASKTVRDMAYDSLGAIKRNNDQYAQPTMAVDIGLSNIWNDDNYNWFNIYGGV